MSEEAEAYKKLSEQEIEQEVSKLRG